MQSGPQFPGLGEFPQEGGPAAAAFEGRLRARPGLVGRAVVRVDGEEDPRIFVSDASAASRSAYGEIILTDELLGRGSDEDLDDLVAELDEDAEEDEEDEDVADDSVDGVPNGPLGDAGLLIEFGVGAKELMDMSVEGAVPGDALTEIADALGCGEVLEAVR